MLKKITPFVLLLCSTELFAASIRLAPQAQDDYASVVVGIKPTASVTLSANDRYGSIVTMKGSLLGQYGYVELSGTSVTYTLYDNSENAKLTAGQVVTDSFTYTYANDVGQSSSARLIVQVAGNQQTPIAIDDSITLVPTNTVFSVTGDVSTNDSNGTSVFISSNSSPVAAYGKLVLAADGSFTYILNRNAPNVIALKTGEVVNDIFSYTYVDQRGKSANAKLTVTIIGNPVDANGNAIIEQLDSHLDNVDIEFNDRSARATLLNSRKNISGHLYSGSDKDWYKLRSNGNEVITIDACPQGSGCFGKKNWVVYVFDGARLAAENGNDPQNPLMEGREYTFNRWVDETGNSTDLQGNNITNNTAGSSNHLYLAYEQGYFDGALIGIVDPCFDTASSVDIGVGAGPRDYFIAVSSPLMGGDAGVPAGQCGAGSTVLERPGVPTSGQDASAPSKKKTFTTTEEYITAFPYSDDQYTIKITGTGRDPLDPTLPTTTAAGSAAFNATSGELNIPKLQILDKMYAARLSLLNQAAPANARGPFNFALSDIQALSPKEITASFQAIYDTKNQRLLIPRLIDTVSGNAYFVAMQYHQEVDGKAQWLELIDLTLIQ
ncbi:Ig-like domain-containing protein [Methylobacter sp. G7]|uniref:VCBS domain-containing protein n=1 Tax=Methylobacter sp. G7 TaxID=3230117 RepID=UPI003D803358